MRVLVTPDYRNLSQTAAALVVKAVQAKPDLTLGLPTGATPIGMYEELVRSFRGGQCDFALVHTFNLDEFAGLSADHPGSYREYMRVHFFEHVNIREDHVHFPDATGDYEEEIRNAGGIDLLILGIGMNGHIAFNEPGSSFQSRTREVELLERKQRAFTMGIATILEARRIVLLASGAAKAGVVHRALHGPVSELMPASILQTHPNVIAILDEDAAGHAL